MQKHADTHYIHKISYSFQERLVGVFVLLAITILITLLFISTTTLRLFEPSFTLHAYMQYAEGVSTETKVHVSGIEVGKVSDISLHEDNRFKVTLEIYERFHDLIRTDSIASLSKLPFIGEAIINIKPGSTGKPTLNENDTLSVDDALPVDQLISNLKPLLDNINETLERLTGVIGAMPQDSVSNMMNNLSDSSEQIKIISRQVASGQGTIGKLLFDPALASNLQTSIAHLNTALNEINIVTNDIRNVSKKLPVMVEQLNNIATTVNKELKQLPDITLQTRRVLNNTDQVIESIQYTWPISSKITDETKDPGLLPVTPQH